MNILQDNEFISANKMFEAKAKLFTKQYETKTQKLSRYFVEGGQPRSQGLSSNRPCLEGGQNKDGVWKNAVKLVEFIWISLCFHFARREIEGLWELTRQSFETKTDDTGARYVSTIWPCVLIIMIIK